MAEIKYKFVYNNEGLVVSPSFLIDMCFYGINLCRADGRTLSDAVIIQYLKAAQSEIERLLGIKLQKQIIKENKDFYLDDWKSWGYIRCTYPAREVFGLDGYVNSVKQVQYPIEWVSTRKTSDGKLYQKNIFLVPVGQGVANQNSIVFSGITPHLGFLNMPNIPNYWQIIYGTGFDKVPDDIIKAICYMAAMPLYMWLGNAILPAGLNSQSISIDGLSQSRSIEAGGFSTKIKQLQEQLGSLDSKSNGLLANLRDYYNPRPVITAM